MINKKEIFKILEIENMTNQQKEAVLEKNTPILICASAGSGKTFVLSKRYIYKILTTLNSKIVEKILVLTFAKSAAEEMFGRIKNQIEKISKNNKNLTKIKNMLSKNLITTIDSFCYKIIKENAKLCNISSNFKIVSDFEIKNLKEYILNFIFEKEFKKNKENFQKLCDYFSLTDDSVLKESILKIYEKSKTMPFPKEYIQNLKKDFQFPKNLNNCDFLKEIKDDLKDKLNKMKQFLEMAIDFLNDEITKKNFEPSLKITIDKIEKIEKEIEILNYEEIEDLLKKFEFENFKKYNKKTNPFNRKLAEEMKKLYIYPAKKIKNSLNEYIIKKEQYIKDFVEQKPFAIYLIDITLKFYKKLEIEKKKKNILEFSDLLTKTIELFVEKNNESEIKLSKIGKKFSIKFEEILIDEFQDINQSQSLLLKIISNSNKKLFMVGDVKQSIYGFRNSDTSTFLKIKNEFEKDNSHGKLIFLNKNFRSGKEITNSVNLIFSQIMSLEFGKIDYKRTEKLVSNNEIYEQKYNTELHILKNEAEKENNEFEMSHIVNVIKNMLDNKFEILENNKKRICTPKDFAILFRSSNEETKILYKKLSEQKINYISFNNESCFNSYEILTLISILKIVNNPFLDISLYAVATSHIFNFTKEEILKIKLKNINKPLFINFKKSKNIKCIRLVKFIKNLIKNLPTKKLDEFIEEIYDSETFLKIFTKIEFNETTYKNKEIFIEIAKKYNEYEKYGLLGFLEYLEEIKSEKIETINKNQSDNDAITITTIHKSKGLEWPIVILPLMSKKFNEEDFKKPILISSKFNLTFKHSKKENLIRYNTIAFNSASIFEKKIQKEEELRLLYVATTRAKNKLILTATDKNDIIKNFKKNKFKDLTIPASYCRNKKSFYEWIATCFLRNNQFKFSQKSNLNCSVEIKTNFNFTIEKQETKNHNQIKNNDILKILKKQILNQKIVENYIPEKLTVTEIVQIKNKKESTKTNLKLPNFCTKEETAKIKGIAMHTFLQYVNFKNAEKNINFEIKRLFEKEFITKKQVKYLDKEKLNNFFYSYTYRLIKNADYVEREKSFLFEIDSKKIFKKIKNKKILIQGIIDCIVQKNNKLILIDYKTDETNEKNLIFKYKTQMQIYKYAIEEIFKKPVKFSIIHSLFLNKAIIVKL